MGKNTRTTRGTTPGFVNFFAVISHLFSVPGCVVSLKKKRTGEEYKQGRHTCKRVKYEWAGTTAVDDIFTHLRRLRPSVEWSILTGRSDTTPPPPLIVMPVWYRYVTF